MSKEHRETLIVYGLFLLFFIGLIVLGYITETPAPETPRFQVVDTYKECDVVQYNHPGDAKSHYFLDCNK